MIRFARARRLLAPAALLALSGILTAPLVGCLDECFADLGALHGERIGGLELADTRLHAWILSWVQQALTEDPASLFDTNAFHPAPRTLTGSEHTLGIAIPLLPARLLTRDAVTLYQLALVLSFPLLGLTTFALLRWLSGATFAAFVGGALAMSMPWRFGELSHIQLLSAQWFPLVWLLVARTLSGQARRFDAPLLALVFALQLLTSFYLAYLLSFSIAVLVAVWSCFERPARGAFFRLLAALAPGLVGLALTAIPYAARAASADLLAEALPIHSLGVASALRALAPTLGIGASSDPRLVYSVPLGVLLLAAATLPGAPRALRDPHARRARRFGVAMWALALAAFVMMLGRELGVAGLRIPLPSQLAAAIVPGFSLLRAPLRWGLLIGLAAPVLAGLGVYALERLSGLGAFPARLLIARGVLLVLLAATLNARPIPARAAWREGDAIRVAHELLRELPAGPAVEIPWPMGALAAPHRESKSLLASTQHWRPILNGYTAYPPASYAFLRRVAQSLPDREALRRLRALAGVRFIVVHGELLSPAQRDDWERAAESGDIELRRTLGRLRLYEVAGDADRGAWTQALLAQERRPKTLTGLSRAPLELARGAGELRVEAPAALDRMLWPRAQHPVRLHIRNRSDVDWPGFDVKRDGLVELRYRFLGGDGAVELEATAPLDADVAAAATTTSTAFIASPSREGRYRVRFDLVQRAGDRLLPLPVDAVERDIRVRPASRNPERWEVRGDG